MRSGPPGLAIVASCVHIGSPFVRRFVARRLAWTARQGARCRPRQSDPRAKSEISWGAVVSKPEITEPLRPATMPCSRPTRNRTRTSEVGARRASVTPRVFESGRPESNGPLRVGDPALSLVSYVRLHTPGWIRTSVLRPRKAALGSAELRACGCAAEPPAGVEPALHPYKGCVLAVDTTEASSGDGGSRTRSSSVQARCSSGRTSSPWPDGGASAAIRNLRSSGAGGAAGGLWAAPPPR